MHARIYDARLVGKGKRIGSTIVGSIDRKFADRRTDSFTCHGCVSGRSGPFPLLRPYFSFLCPIVRDFSNRRDSAIDPLAPRIASLDFVQGEHLLRSLFPPPANHVFLACQGIVSSVRRGERLASNLENTKLNRRRSLSSLSLSLLYSSIFVRDLLNYLTNRSYEDLNLQRISNPPFVFLSLALERRVKQSHSTELHLMLSM